jgi:hypothetical protein
LLSQSKDDYRIPVVVLEVPVVAFIPRIVVISEAPVIGAVDEMVPGMYVP